MCVIDVSELMAAQFANQLQQPLETLSALKRPNAVNVRVIFQELGKVGAHGPMDLSSQIGKFGGKAQALGDIAKT